MTESQVPAGWRRATVGDVASLVRNGIFARRPTDEPVGVPILRISAVRSGHMDLDQRRYVADLDAETISKYAIQPGDLLFTRYNGSRTLVGVCARVPEHEGPVIHPDKLIRVVPRDDIVDGRFLGLLTETASVRRFIEPRIKTTAGQSGITGKDVRDIPISYPHLAEQRRIVEILEDHLSRLDAARTQLIAAAQRSKTWRRAIVDHLLSADGALPRQVGDLLREPMRNGHSARAVRDGEAGVRTLTLTAVTRGVFTEAFTKVAAADPRRVAGLWLCPGDILVQRSNTPELVGTTAMYGGPSHWAIFPDLMIRLRVDEEVVLPEYITAALRSERVHHQLRGKAKGLAGSMPKIDQVAIASLTVPVPPLVRQRELVGRLVDVDQSWGRLADAVKAAELRGTALRRTLLDAAFSGRLTGRASDMEIVEEMTGV